ncbi:AHH domain-containing protein, partial [Xenorhabdus vietnamensis]|uniref:AHH domain-containing protein n=1 Tax=Xenorhabdus vietnamensis TaxID=351656 RepID=UPI001FC94052
MKKIDYDIDVAANGIFLRKVDDGVSAMTRHQGNHNGYTDAMRNALDRIDLKQSKEAISKQVANIQDIAKKGMMDGNII